MAMIRPLFAECPRSADDGFKSALDALHAHIPAGAVSPDDVDAEVQKALNWLAITLKIHAFAAAPTDVANHLEMVARRADRCRRDQKPESQSKLRSALTPPDLNAVGLDLAKLIAIEYLACSALASSGPKPVRKDGIGARAIHCLAALDLSHPETLQWVAFWARKQRKLVLEHQEVTAQRMSVMEGAELIEGRRFKFRPDPIKVRYARPLSDCLDDFVGQLCLIYRWAGGATYIPRDGREPNVFESFVNAVENACPTIRQHGSLKSRASKVLREEKRGLRTLGFQSEEL